MSVLHEATYTRSQKESNDRHRRWYATPPPKPAPEKRAAPTPPKKKVPPKRDMLIVSTAALTAIEPNTTGRTAPVNAPPVENIIKAICIVSKTQRWHLVGERKTRHLARLRQIAFYIARHATALSYPQIGHKFSKRDHTTVMHGVKMIELLRSGPVEETLQAVVKMLRIDGFVVDVPQIEKATQ